MKSIFEREIIFSYYGGTEEEEIRVRATKKRPIIIIRGGDNKGKTHRPLETSERVIEVCGSQH